ncbi:hypothetical protein [Acetobacter oryzoeni]|uniref:Uncharacterized protein n=1 Tax=Acetobacter oryzoeni TaxID=2500548 RepID=A0A5B9GK47_9PROT|nr:hypothetical protein [Acetobacter oryzoeni]MCP1203326.1 hypothetical protein [Acetobacter oryzoeni]QEE86671.1 hypothetical protein EOV40_013040 [Acetobacter oryzoeni]
MGVETGSFFVGTFGASVDCWSAIALGTVAQNKDARAKATGIFFLNILKPFMNQNWLRVL